MQIRPVNTIILIFRKNRANLCLFLISCKLEIKMKIQKTMNSNATFNKNIFYIRVTTGIWLYYFV